MDHGHTEDDPGQTIYVLKCLFQQSVVQLFSVDNLNSQYVVHHFFQSALLASKGE